MEKWTGKVVLVEGVGVVVNRGLDCGVRVGHRALIRVYSAEMVDPETGVVIGSINEPMKFAVMSTYAYCSVLIRVANQLDFPTVKVGDSVEQTTDG